MHTQDVYLDAIRVDLISLAQRLEIEYFKEKLFNLINVQNFGVNLLDSINVLHISAWLKDMELCEKLLDLGCNPFSIDSNGDTTLHYAVRSNNLKYIIKIHSTLGNDVLNVTNHRLCNLLLTACAEAVDNNPSELLQMLEWFYFAGMSLEVQDNTGKTPLHWAVYRNSKPIVHWLISRGAHIGHRDHMNRTVLHIAAAMGNDKIALFLCDKGAVPLLYAESNDKKSLNTATKIAWNRGNLWFALSSIFWCVSHKLFGKSALVKNGYAFCALCLLIYNLLFTLLIYYLHYSISPNSADYKNFLQFGVHCLWTLLTYLLALKLDPGSISKESIVLPSQTCYKNYHDELEALKSQQISTNYEKYMYKQKLLNYEIESKRLGLMISETNAKYKFSNKKQTAYKFDKLLKDLAKIVDAINAIKLGVSIDRKTSSMKEYVLKVMSAETNLNNVCFTCHDFKGFRSHHCSECGICIRKFDHHCVWIDNCVGIGNQVSFLCFLICLVSATIYYYNISFRYIIKFISSNTKMFDLSLNMSFIKHDLLKLNLTQLLTSPLTYLILLNTIISLSWLMFSFYLLLRTFRSMITDVTFYETIRPGTHIYYRFGKRDKDSKFWDFKNLTFFGALANIIFFCIQSPARDEVNYPDVPAIQSKMVPLYSRDDARKIDKNSTNIAWYMSNFGGKQVDSQINIMGTLTAKNP